MQSFRLLHGAGRFVLVIGLLVTSAAAQDTTRVSVDSTGAEGDADSGIVADYPPSFSAEGRYVTFESSASNLIFGDTNDTSDVFVHDRVSASTVRVSVNSSGLEGNDSSFHASLSADGRLVAFVSYADNLVAGDGNGDGDIFVHDRDPDDNGIFDEGNGITTRVSVDSNGVEGNAFSGWPSISADGRFVAFDSLATNLVSGDNSIRDVYVHDRLLGRTVRMSVNSMGKGGNSMSHRPAISSSGRFVIFNSEADNLVPGDTNGSYDVFVHDRDRDSDGIFDEGNGITTRMSVDSNGVEGNSESGMSGASASISIDGRFVAFASRADNLVSGDTNGVTDVFVHDRDPDGNGIFDDGNGITTRESVNSAGVEANGDSRSWCRSLSADGRFVAFASDASNLVDGDTNGVSDVFIHDRITGTTERVSVDSSALEANHSTFNPAISANALSVAFASAADNLVSNDTNGVFDVFVHEINGVDASWTNYGAGFPGTNGIPSFTSQADPVLGTTLTLDLANSFGAFTPGLLFLGFERTQIHSSWGGELLVVPLLTLVVTLPAGGTSFTGDIPIDPKLSGFTIDLQAIELDPGAAHGVSFTQGLELLLGR